MEDGNTEVKQMRPVLIKVLEFFDNLQSKDPLLYTQYVRDIVINKVQESIRINFEGGYIVFRVPAYHSKSNRVMINIGGILDIAFAHFRKWVEPTQLTYDETRCDGIKEAWRRAIEECKVLKKIKLINFKLEFGAVTEIYVRIDP